jgi:hypothetical protein
MRVQNKHRFHGAALTQIVEHRSFKALNRASDAYGHYIVNTNPGDTSAGREIFIKYIDSPPGRSAWHFSLMEKELDRIGKAVSEDRPVSLVLVCGEQEVCLLSGDDLAEILDFAAASQSIRVSRPGPGKRLVVSGPSRPLRHTVPRTWFPAKLFD